jgi:hypothetical protein
MPQALLFEQVFEAARGLFGVVLHRVLYSRDCVVWLMLAVKTRVVIIVATPMILDVVVAARVALALARLESYLAFALSTSSAHDVIMSLSLVMELGRR